MGQSQYEQDRWEMDMESLSRNEKFYIEFTSEQAINLAKQSILKIVARWPRQLKNYKLPERN